MDASTVYAEIESAPTLQALLAAIDCSYQLPGNERLPLSELIAQRLTEFYGETA